METLQQILSGHFLKFSEMNELLLEISHTTESNEKRNFKQNTITTISYVTKMRILYKHPSSLYADNNNSSGCEFVVFELDVSDIQTPSIGV